MSKKVLTECLVCGNTNLVRMKEDRTVSYQGSVSSVDGLEYDLCETCGESFYAPESERRLDKAFADLRRTVEGLLTSSEIKAIRDGHGWTQTQLSSYLGMAEKTIARYESGIAIQSESVDKFLRVIRDVDGVSEYLANPGKIIVARKEICKVTPFPSRTGYAVTVAGSLGSVLDSECCEDVV